MYLVQALGMLPILTDNEAGQFSLSVIRMWASVVFARFNSVAVSAYYMCE